MESNVLEESRVRIVRNSAGKRGNLIYWMSREQRVNDNFALSRSLRRSKDEKKPFCVIFVLFKEYPNANSRHFSFMYEGLREVGDELDKMGIPFGILKINKIEDFTDFINEFDISDIVTDFDPVKIKKEWQTKVIENTSAGLEFVDSCCAVPLETASQKREYSARTIRGKIMGKLYSYLNEKSPIMKPYERADIMKGLLKPYALNTELGDFNPVSVKGGAKAAEKLLKHFIRYKLPYYSEFSNDPAKDISSHLSPYIHFGNISALHIANEVIKASTDRNSDAFIEQLIVRRELAHNFCMYSDYLKEKEMPRWALETLKKHTNDTRENIYTLKELENAQTYDPAWNAAQNQMVKTGYMHGYMRMYWAKRILEWSRTPKDAFSRAVYLNDRYQLDGRDPNGYTGIAWSIYGLHDRPWSERRVFGTVRSMTYSGLRRKFEIDKYIEKYA